MHRVWYGPETAGVNEIDAVNARMENFDASTIRSNDMDLNKDLVNTLVKSVELPKSTEVTLQGVEGRGPELRFNALVYDDEAHNL